jgi:hypothetical protein
MKQPRGSSHTFFMRWSRRSVKIMSEMPFGSSGYNMVSTQVATFCVSGSPRFGKVQGSLYCGNEIILMRNCRFEDGMRYLTGLTKQCVQSEPQKNIVLSARDPELWCTFISLYQCLSGELGHAARRALRVIYCVVRSIEDSFKNVLDYRCVPEILTREMYGSWIWVDHISCMDCFL